MLRENSKAKALQIEPLDYVIGTLKIMSIRIPFRKPEIETLRIESFPKAIVLEPLDVQVDHCLYHCCN